MKKRMALSVFFALIAMPFQQGFAIAQSSPTIPTNLDIIGIKLGIGIDEAKNELKSYNQNIEIKVLFATDNRELLPMWGDRGEEDASIQKSKIKVPIALLAYVKDAGSEVFNLRFTPTDDGGRLYAIARLVKYSAPGETPEQLAQKFIAKYGKPTSATNRQIQLFWEYDIRGRQLSENNRDARRCQSVTSTISFRKIATPWFDAMGKYASNENQFKQCGIQLEMFSDFNGEKVTGFLSSLSDQNALGYDNGIEAYVRGKMEQAGEAEPIGSPPKL